VAAFVLDNETRALNALKALCALPSAWGEVKILWSCRQQPLDFVVFLKQSKWL